MWRLATVVSIAAAALAAGGRRPQDGSALGPLSRTAAAARAVALADLGRRLFVDPALSASGRQSCASCHDPSRAFGPPDDAPVQPGGERMERAGHRAVPSLMYLQALPPFSEHFFESEDDGDSSVDNGPTGGLNWDGRVDRVSDHARLPLLSPFEMANGSGAGLAARIAGAPYAGDLSRLFGPSVSTDGEAVLRGIGLALEAYLEDPATFAPYSSRYDAFLAGRGSLSPAEARGREAFEDPARGDCARCHPSEPSPTGLPPLFTDYGLVALGVPRNPAIPANADPSYFDLGLCGPDRTDLAGRADDCGRFMTPTLRNVATRRVFFHNGVVHDLREAVEFYASRDVRPEQWYPRDRSGRIEKFDDLPGADRGNVEMEPPFGGIPDGRPALSAQDVDDIAAFLGTLTDRRAR
jgi:cytochrome c peroxidase